MTDVTRSQTWRRKRNRLDPEAYRGAFAFAVTITTWHRERLFTTERWVDLAREALVTASRDHGFEVLAYCFMPDHLHLLVEGTEDSDLVPFIKAFKQATAFAFKRETGRCLWQRSYYDHIVNGEDDLNANIDYIIANPVVAGIVDDATAYPFSGGAVLEDMLVAT